MQQLIEERRDPVSIGADVLDSLAICAELPDRFVEPKEWMQNPVVNAGPLNLIRYAP